MARAKKKSQDPTEDKKKHDESSEVRKWLTRIEQSERYRKRISERYRWVRLVEEYKGYFQGLTDSTDIYIPSLNYMFAYVKSEIPALYHRNPKIKVNPKKNTSVQSAKILELAINAIWRKNKIKRENKKNLFDNMVYGHSWLKTGYSGKFGSIEDGNGNTYEFIQEEDFFGYRIPVDNVTFNPDAQDPPYDCRWIAHEVWMPLEEAQQNKKFKNTDDLQPSRPNPESTALLSTAPAEDINRGDPDVEKCKIYEVWDKKTLTVFLISNGVDGYIQEPRPWPCKMKGFPFSFLRLNDDPNSPYGIPDTYMFEPQVMELMKIRASELDHLKRFNRQLAVAEGHINDDDMAKFTQAITGAVIKIRTDGRPIGEIIQPIAYPPLPSDIYGIEDRLKVDIIKISGQSDLDQGAPQKTQSRSLGEVMQIEQAGTKRRAEKLDVLEDFIIDICQNYTALLQQLADVPYFVRTTGEDASQIMQMLKNRPSSSAPSATTTTRGFTFTKEDIQGDFDFEIVPGSTAPLDTTQQWQLCTMMIQEATQAGAIPGGPFIRALSLKLAELSDMPELELAMQEELKLADQMKQSQQQQSQSITQAKTAEVTGQLHLKAEREATRQMDTQIKAMKAVHDINIAHKELNMPEPQQPVEQNEPEDKVSKSISFKDLPVEGQVQLAAQAGIHLTPEQAQALQDHLDKQTQAKKPKANSGNGM